MQQHDIEELCMDFTSSSSQSIGGQVNAKR